MILVSEIERLCSLGCNVTLNATDYLSDTLIKFAAISNKAGGILTLKNTESLISTTRERIAAAGKNHVTFDFS